jgi:glyoxylase-like metal-dependent hydrolase (beta-lactamase superfamily II)
MTHRVLVLTVLAVLMGGTAAAQLAPGFVDPQPVLAAAARAIGTDNLKCVVISGTGYAGMVGQQKESGRNIDWPRGEALANFTRTMNWENQTMKEEFDRKPGLYPASWKYGSGWKGGTPLAQNAHQIFAVNGKYAWHMDGPGGASVAAPPDDAERWQLDLWMNPHGFLKAARMPGANPRATWRWELGEMGRDGNTTVPEKVTVVAITVLGKFRVDATINKANMLQRIHTMIPDPVLGDMNYEHEFSDETYIDIGNGVRFPTRWHHHDGWDDNYGAQNITAGHNGFGGNFATIRANSCTDPVAVPDAVRQANFAVRVDSQKLADGVYLLGGGTHNSVAVEFKNFITVVEAPLDERRSLAVIDTITKLIPNKPIRFLVNTHQHFDHIGGIRTYMHIGATIITQWKNWDFYTRDVLNYAPRTLEPDMLSQWPPTELAEGYQYETVRENYILSDGARNMNITYVQPLAHAEGMLMAYLPAEKIAIEADLFDPPPPNQPPSAPTAANKSFYTQVERLGMDVSTIAPIHGRAVPWSDFLRVINNGGK